MSNAKKIQRAFLQPFSQDDLEFRVQSSGEYSGKHWARIVAYVTNRAIQQRLDDVVGTFGWKNEFTPLPNGNLQGALCGISIKFDGEWITKYDGADNTAIESTKGGLSNAQKRAAVEWGIGRYLYDVESSYAIVISQDEFKKLQKQDKNNYEKAKAKDNDYFYWKAPKLDDRFLPKKHLSKSAYDTIKELIQDTDTKEPDFLELYGVEDLKDLYSDEAGKITTALLLKKGKQNATTKTN